MIAHVVMWKLKDTADVPRFVAALERCADLVPGQLEFEIGTPAAGLGSSSDVVLVSRFADPEVLQAYLEHPTHVEVVGELAGLRESREAVDYAYDA